jgi:hypothetical protein
MVVLQPSRIFCILHWLGMCSTAAEQSTAEHSTAQHSTAAQPSTTQHNTTQLVMSNSNHHIFDTDDLDLGQDHNDYANELTSHQPVNTNDLDEQDSNDRNEHHEGETPVKPDLPASAIYTLTNLLDYCIYHNIRSLFTATASVFRSNNLPIPHQLQLKLLHAALQLLFSSRDLQTLIDNDIEQVSYFIRAMKEFNGIQIEQIKQLEKSLIKAKHFIIIGELQLFIRNLEDKNTQCKPLQEIGDLFERLFTATEGNSQPQRKLLNSASAELAAVINPLKKELNNNRRNISSSTPAVVKAVEYCNSHNYSAFCDNFLSLLAEIKSHWEQPFYCNTENLPDWSYFIGNTEGNKAAEQKEAADYEMKYTSDGKENNEYSTPQPEPARANKPAQPDPQSNSKNTWRETNEGAVEETKSGPFLHQPSNDSATEKSSALDFLSAPDVSAAELEAYCDSMGIDWSTLFFQVSPDILTFKVLNNLLHNASQSSTSSKTSDQ